MKVLSLLGAGLMGGSLGLALRKQGSPLRIQAYARRQETRDALLERGMADAVFADPAEAVQGADLVILCVPVQAMPALLEQAKAGLKSGALVTDVGSTKAWLDVECRAVLADSAAEFIGSHPMCGSEKSGVEAAKADLYEQAVCVICAATEQRARVVELAEFWRSLGSRVVELEAKRHDELAAAGSHVPHLAASALVRAAWREDEGLKDLIGGGFRCSTRVASGEPGMWRDIVESNASAVASELRKLQQELFRVSELLEAEDFDGVYQYLDEAAHWREDLVKARNRDGEDVVAIDGPSASGKSTVAKGVASRMGLLYVDSGAMYRGMTWQVLREGVDPKDEAGIREVMKRSRWEFRVEEEAVRYRINGEDPGEAIRGEAVRETVSYVARVPEVRSFIVDRIREMRSLGRLVVEGRDIGSVIFPESRFKFYLDADAEERARRRNAELVATEGNSSAEAVLESLRKRDNIDSTRKTAPLQVASGAQFVDTTYLTLEQVVDKIHAEIRSRSQENG